MRVDVAGLLDRVEAELGEDARILSSLVSGAEASASARDGDIVAAAELLWASP